MFEMKGKPEAGNDSVKTTLHQLAIPHCLPVQRMATSNNTQVILARTVDSHLGTALHLRLLKVSLHRCLIRTIKDTIKEVPAYRAMVHLQHPMSITRHIRRLTDRTKATSILPLQLHIHNITQPTHNSPIFRPTRTIMAGKARILTRTTKQHTSQLAIPMLHTPYLLVMVVKTLRPQARARTSLDRRTLASPVEDL